ncbi:vWA domain-containing protein [Catellatospora tritici]|uniref:vWA domain-containing protein n=1 Tax=Catellatospora tritici TaxID=2851566 RepID=UPI001C2D0ED6|nr:VWA domain-containing protein [Catellatospora tritici]MBV1850042.1 VWA domain-containing protein [Catellatospora tritici]
MNEIRATLLPVYFVVDESASMAPHMAELNKGLADLHAALLAQPMTAAKVRITVMGFSDTVKLHLHLADLRRVTSLPQLTIRTQTYYSAAFDALDKQIPVDIKHLKDQQFAVHRPAVFFLTDGQPTDGTLWHDVHRRLVDRVRTPSGPNIVAFGVGDVHPQTILSVATSQHYAFVSTRGMDISVAIANVCVELTRSVIRSGSLVGSSNPELFVERPQGFAMAIDLV